MDGYETHGFEVGAEPGGEVAVIGLACRFPGADGPEEFWRLLDDGRSAVREIPPERASAGTPPVRWGGYLDRVDAFDAGFFRIAPNEAAAMDPQQRLMLELGWEALEDAGIVPAVLRGTDTGVFTGAFTHDYATLVHREGADAITRHTLTGLDHGIIANRLSHILGLHGPSMTVDAGQASGLVAVDMAVESLRRGGCELAIAGAVNLILAPDSGLTTWKFGALSPDGRCYTFDARANGYVRGEGGGAVVLKPLAQALADGDPVYCVIRGSAVNNDGATDSLTVPSGAAQAAVARRACAQARTDPADVQYVELHGTGTPVGDPVEAAALGAAYGAARACGHPLAVGSVKTNIGHLEGAAGIAGLIKTALSIHHRRLPASLNFTAPNPRIPLDELNLRVRTATGPWPRPGRPLVAGVSSFGMGGTNCHLLLAEPPPVPAAEHPRTASGTALPWTVSGTTPAALRDQAARLRDHIARRPDADVGEVAHALATTRTAFRRRAAVVATDRAGFLRGLAALADGADTPEVVRGTALPDPVPAVAFTGAATRRPRIHPRLVEAFPVFARALDGACAALGPRLGPPVRAVLHGRVPPGGEFVQPALFAADVALFRLFEEWGLSPGLVAGEGLGEITAAHVAGVLELADAGLLVAARARLGRVPPGTDRAADPAAEEFARSAARCAAWPPRIPLVSARTGGLATAEVCSADHWLGHADAARGSDTRAAAAGRTPHDLGAGVVLAVGGPAESGPVRDGAPPGPLVGATAGEADGGSPAHIVRTLCELHVSGVEVDWARLLPRGGGHPRTRPTLPTYAFQREPHWLSRRPDPSATDDTPDHTDAASEPVPESPQQTLPAHPAPATASDTPAAEEARYRHALATVRTAAADLLGHTGPEAIDPALTFTELGFDSHDSAALGARLRKVSEVSLPDTLIFDHPTPAVLARRIAGLSAPPQRPDRSTAPTAFGLPPADPAPRPEPSRSATSAPPPPLVPAPAAPDPAEPIAIVGMACRYPGGADSPEDLWRLVTGGVDAIGPFPHDRGWDLSRLFGGDSGTHGHSSVREGGFLHRATEFDAGFFGISPREALAMDPQQRLLLETSWEALERAGIDPASMHGSRTGVFVGAMSPDYGPRLHDAPRDLEGLLLTGGTASVLSGRVAYSLGLEGPAVTVDTACSSSLVALHLAVRDLRSGSCDLALAGGAAVMSGPGMFTEFSRQQGLAPDARCKAFAAAADGTAWAEGVGVLLLEPLSLARSRGHRVLALIRGSAVNQDGASNGLTAPSGAAQERVIRAALADARLGAADVDAVEAHGTGTRLGDPIEANALLATYGREHGPDDPLWLGSLKSNIGHAQAAAGVGGVIKMVMAMRDAALPPTLHVDAPTPHADWSQGGIALLTAPTPWADRGRPRRAAVSSFGISGTNAHMVLERPDDTAAAAVPPHTLPHPAGRGAVLPWVLSAKSDDALRAHARRLRDAVETDPAVAGADGALSLATTRATFEHRAVVLAADRDGVARGLDAAARGDGDTVGAAVVRRRGALGPVCDPVFVFPGQGAQWPGMAVELLDASPVFRERMEACAAALERFTGWSLFDALRRAPGAPPPDRVDVVQPTLWAVMVSLAHTWGALGVRPAAVVGHSQGEIAAACVTGALSLDDAAKTVALRSRAVGALAGTGGMVSLALPEQQAAGLLEPWRGRLHIATVNGPNATVAAGEAVAVYELLDHCATAGIRAHRIGVDYASHTPFVAEVRDEVTTALAGLDPREPAVPFFSTLTGDRLTDTPLDADYWYRALRSPVRFGAAVRTLVDAGHGLFIEISPHPVLTGAIEDTLGAADAPGAAVGTLRRHEGGWDRFLASAAEAFVHGAPVDWTPVVARPGARRVDLPTYPFQRERYWLPPATAAPDAASLGVDAVDHPLLGAAVDLADDGTVLTAGLSPHRVAWLAEHTVDGTPLFPAAGFAELALRAGDRVGRRRVRELDMAAPLPLTGDDTVQVRLTVDHPGAEGERPFTVHSRLDGDGPWTRNATGLLADGTPCAEPLPAAWPPPGAAPVDLDRAYERLAERGYGYGPAFRGLHAAWRDGPDLFADIALPDDSGGEPADYGLHPALLDAALHALLLDEPADRGLLVPFRWSDMCLHAVGARELRVRLRRTGPDTVAVRATDPAGAPVLTTDLELREAPADWLSALGRRTGSLYHLDWEPLSVPETGSDEGVAVLGGTAPLPGARAGEFLDAAALARAIDAGIPAPRVALAVCPIAPGGSDAHPVGGTHAAAQWARATIRAWLADPRLADTALAVVTRGGTAAVPGDVPAPGQAAVWGLVAAAQSEHPGRFVLVDVDGDLRSPAALTALLGTGEPRIAVRRGGGRVPRLARHSTAPPLSVAPGWRLDAGGTGGVDDLAPVAVTDLPLGRTEVRVDVRAAGLNFRDVLIAVGLYPGGGTMGCEAAGVVTEIGPDVTGLRPGDRVMGLFDGAFGPTAVTDYRRLVPVPDAWPDTLAAAVPVVHATAYHALVEVAAVTKGDSVLIHAATGGVGTAAVRLARHLGAEVFATAHPAKWPVLRAMGLDDEHIASSRTAEFEERFRQVTSGRGVDVVLNALAGDLTDASLRLLAPGGRFVEMGRTDVRDPDEVAAAHPGTAYHPIDLLELPHDRVRALLEEVTGLLREARLDAPPVAVWDLRHAPEALRHLSRAEHTGKVVLSVPRAADPEGTALITGGTGTLGALVARHLVTAHGVRHLVLAGRRGPDAPGAERLRDELAALGATVALAACDVADRSALAAVIDAIPAEHPLTTVVHAAGVLEDAPSETMTAEALDRALGAKADAAWHLHELTRDRDLAAFVLFSSAIGVLGGPGQGAYAAANTALDALARHRHALGLPGVSLAWGLWQQASGMTGHLGDGDRARLARLGLAPMPTERGLALFDAALSLGRPHLVPADLDTASPVAASVPPPPPLRGLLRIPDRPAARTSPAARAPWAADVPPAERRRALLDLVRREAAAVLGHSGTAGIPPHRPFSEAGFDSLTSVELRNRLAAATGVRGPSSLLFDHPTPSALSGWLAGRLSPEEGQGGGAPAQPTAPDTATDEARRALDGIPPAVLRASGLLDALLDLARTPGDPADSAVPRPRDSDDPIDAMAAEELVNLALDDHRDHTGSAGHGG
nr:type I polyketide synthase [Nocardiopsis mwathae]